MYLNSGELLHDNSTSTTSNTCTNSNSSQLDTINTQSQLQLKPQSKLDKNIHHQHPHTIPRLKRYNSLPNVTEYLEQHHHTSLPEPTKQLTVNHDYTNSELNSIISVLSQDEVQIHRKQLNKPYLNPNPSPNPNPDAVSNSSFQVSHLPTSFSTEFINTPRLTSELSHQEPYQPGSYQFNWESHSRPFLNNPSFGHSGNQEATQFVPQNGHDLLPNSLLDYSDIQARTLNHHMTSLPDSSSHDNFHMRSNSLKRMRPDDDINHTTTNEEVNHNTNQDLVFPTTLPFQPATLPDPNTTQAAQDAIIHSSHCPPPVETIDDTELIPRNQPLRYPGDLYTPQWVRGTGQQKEGYCDLCHPGKWLQLKNSAFWYHKQFFHGISSISGTFFLGPHQTRHRELGLIEGQCHQCHQFIPMSSPKRRNSVLWFRHAHKCHIYNRPKTSQLVNRS